MKAAQCRTIHATAQRATTPASRLFVILNVQHELLPHELDSQKRLTSHQSAFCPVFHDQSHSP